MSLRWTSGAGAPEVVSELGGPRSAAGVEPTGWARVPEGNVGPTVSAQVPEGSAAPTAGRCPCLSSPGWPPCSAAPDPSPGCTCGLRSWRSVQAPARGSRGERKLCGGAVSARTPRAGNLDSGLWGGVSQDPRRRPPGPCACQDARCSLGCCC